MSASFRTDLHTVNGAVTNQYYLSNIINPIVISLHKQHRPYFILADDNAPGHRARVIILLLWEAGVTQVDLPASPQTQSHKKLMVSVKHRLWSLSIWTLNPYQPEGSRSRRVDCDTSTIDKYFCEQYETPLSSCAWLFRSHDPICHFLLFWVVSNVVWKTKS